MKKIIFNYIIVVIIAIIGIGSACSPSKGVVKEDSIARRNSGKEDSYAFDEKNSKNSDEMLFEESLDKNEQGGERLDEMVKQDNPSVKGIASWYGRAFHGRKTASGERFDMYDYTAAHRKYPFGTILMVKNLENGKTIKVRVNDRGPYKDDRIIDLSYAAGRKLGMLAKGKAMVEIKALNNSGNGYDDEPAFGSKVDDKLENYKIQAGAFYSRKNAEKLQARIQGIISESEIVITRENDFYKVRITGIGSKVAAERYKAMLADEEIPGFVVNK